METMKAAFVERFGGPETISFKDVPRPRPKSNEVLVRIEATSINPIDWKLREGYFKSLPLPFIPGGDFCGTVEEVGRRVTAFQKGDSIYGVAPGSIGAGAQFVCVPEKNASLKPRALGPIEAASVPLTGMTAWQALFTYGQLKAGQTVFILGASGGVGSMAVQLAKSIGARVIGTASTENIERLRQIGCDQVIDYKKEDFAKVLRDIDLCLDLVGGDDQKKMFSIIKSGGRLVSTVQPPDEKAAAEKEISALFFRMTPDSDQLRELAAKIDAGDLKVQVAKVLPFERVAEAEELNRRHEVEGKIVLQVYHA